MSTRNKKIYKVGDQLNLRVNKKISKPLLKWINTRKKIGPEIFDILEKYVNGELVNASVIVGLITNNSEVISINSEEVGYIDELDNTVNTTDLEGGKDNTVEVDNVINNDGIISDVQHTETYDAGLETIKEECNIEFNENIKEEIIKEENIKVESVSNVIENKISNPSRQKNSKKPLLSATPTFAKKTKNVFADNK